MRSISFTPRFYVAATLLVIILLIAIFGPMIVRTDPNATVGGLYDRPAGWGPLLLGTDNEGQSVVANLVYGTRTSLIVGLIAGTIATVIGLTVGIIAGFRGGWLDSTLSRFAEIFIAIPLLLGGIVFLTVYPNQAGDPYFLIVGKIVLVLTILSWPRLMRIMRGSVLQVKPAE